MYIHHSPTSVSSVAVTCAYSSDEGSSEHAASVEWTDKGSSEGGVTELQAQAAELAGSGRVQLTRRPLQLTLTCLFDGHNGSSVARWLAREMGARLNTLEDPTSDEQLIAAVEQADADVMADPQLRVHGSTACIVLIKHLKHHRRRLIVANVSSQTDCWSEGEGLIGTVTEALVCSLFKLFSVRIAAAPLCASSYRSETVAVW